MKRKYRSSYLATLLFALAASFIAFTCVSQASLAQSSSFDIVSRKKDGSVSTHFSLAFLRDKALVKGLFLHSVGGCANQGLVIPKNAGNVRIKAITASYAADRLDHRITMEDVGISHTHFNGLRQRVDAGQCRLLEYNFSIRDDKKYPGKEFKNLHNLAEDGSYECVPRPLSAFEERKC